MDASRLLFASLAGAFTRWRERLNSLLSSCCLQRRFACLSEKRAKPCNHMGKDYLAGHLTQLGLSFYICFAPGANKRAPLNSHTNTHALAGTPAHASIIIHKATLQSNFLPPPSRLLMINSLNTLLCVQRGRFFLHWEPNQLSECIYTAAT